LDNDLNIKSKENINLLKNSEIHTSKTITRPALQSFHPTPRSMAVKTEK